MRITIISNGFQEGYVYNLLNGLAPTANSNRITLIGSSVYQPEKINSTVIFKNLGGNPGLNSFIKKIVRNFRYYFGLLRQVNRSYTDVIHLIWLNLTAIDGIILPLYFRLTGIKSVIPHMMSCRIQGTISLTGFYSQLFTEFLIGL